MDGRKRLMLGNVPYAFAHGAVVEYLLTEDGASVRFKMGNEPVTIRTVYDDGSVFTSDSFTLEGQHGYEEFVSMMSLLALTHGLSIHEQDVYPIVDDERHVLGCRIIFTDPRLPRRNPISDSLAAESPTLQPATERSTRTEH